MCNTKWFFAGLKGAESTFYLSTTETQFVYIVVLNWFCTYSAKILLAFLLFLSVLLRRFYFVFGDKVSEADIVSHPISLALAILSLLAF